MNDDQDKKLIIAESLIKQALVLLGEIKSSTKPIKHFLNYEQLCDILNNNQDLLHPKDIIIFTGEGYCTSKNVPYEYFGIKDGIAFFVSCDPTFCGNMNVWLKNG